MHRAIRDAAARGLLPLAIVFALALAAFYVANAVAQVAVSAIAQHVNRSNDSDFGDLSFHIGSTRIDYSYVLQNSLAFAFLAGGLYWLWRRARSGVRLCPDCRSEIPADAAVCRYCTADLTTAAEARAVPVDG